MIDSAMVEELPVVGYKMITTTAADTTDGMEPEYNQRTQAPKPDRDVESDPVGSELTQAGVRKAEVVIQAWTKRSLYIAYLG